MKLKYTRILSLLLCAAIACSVLAGLRRLRCVRQQLGSAQFCFCVGQRLCSRFQ